MVPLRAADGMRFALCFPLLLALPRSLPGEWWKARDARLEVYAEGSAKRALDLYHEMRRTALALATAMGPLPDSAPAVRVVVFGRARDFQPYRPGVTTKGFYQSGPERNYILLLGTAEDALRAGRHEYAHLVLNHTAGRLPQWLEEGLAEFYSTIGWERNGLQVGRVLPGHIALLRAVAWLEVGFFTQPRDAIAGRLTDVETGIYYAQSWALAHYLLHAAGVRGGVRQFTGYLAEGLSQEAAFEKAFGRTIGEALRETRKYVEADRFRVAVVRPGPPPAWEDPPVTRVDEAEMLAVRADLFAVTGRPAGARRLYEEFVRRAPRDPRAVTGLGLVALREGQFEEARARLEEAIRLGSTEAATHFEYAMLLRDQRGPEELVVKNLREAVRLNPSFAEAWFVLGTMALRRNQPWEAVEALERAAEILPRQAVFWENLARALLAAGQREPARGAARRAAAAARNTQESELARAVLREAEGRDATPPAAGPRVVIPGSWSVPQAPETAEGRLVAVDCSGPAVRFEIESGERRLRLEAADPGAVKSTDPLGAPREIRCGPQVPPAPVRAGFDPRARRLLTLEFR
jgi:tetratricopeptide (TPR) repeat protein